MGSQKALVVATNARETDGPECAPCYDIRRSSLGGIPQSEVDKLIKGSSDFQCVHKRLRKTTVLEKDGEGRCKYEKVDPEHFYEKGQQDYVGAFEPYQF